MSLSVCLSVCLSVSLSISLSLSFFAPPPLSLSLYSPFVFLCLVLIPSTFLFSCPLLLTLSLCLMTLHLIFCLSLSLLPSLTPSILFSLSLPLLCSLSISFHLNSLNLQIAFHESFSSRGNNERGNSLIFNLHFSSHSRACQAEIYDDGCLIIFSDYFIFSSINDN